MQLQIIIFLLPLAVNAHRYRVSTDPNDAPFLPIFPIYPYSPKLIKRGVERDHSLGEIHSELYAPKPDATDSYSTNYNGNYPRDSHSSTPSQNVYQPTYASSNQGYTQSTAYTPGSNIPSQYYNVNPYVYAIYNGYPVTLVAQSPSVNPTLSNNHYNHQQHQQYNPHYHQTYSSAIGMSQSSEDNDGKIYGKYQNIPKNELNIKNGDFTDGTNYLTNSKELDVSASTYRMPNHVNRGNDVSDVHLRSAQLPKTMFRIVPYDGQQFRPSNYAVVSDYKYQQLEQQLMNQALGKVIGQPATVANVGQTQYDYGQVNQNVPGKISAQLSTAPVIAKTGLAYVMNPTSLNVAPSHISKVPNIYQNLDSSAVSIKGHKPVTTVSVEGSHGVYIPPFKLYKNQAQLSDYNDYPSQSGDIYNGSTSSISNDYKKNEQNYSPDDIQTIQSAASYQYSGYQPTSNTQQQFDNYKLTLDDVNYASKRKS